VYIAVDSVGLQINMNAGIDITSGTLTMEITKPITKTTASKTVIVDVAATGQVHYITIANDLDEVGVYLVRSKWVPSGGGLLYGEETSFQVSPL
jgi:hypothetical protein